MRAFFALMLAMTVSTVCAGSFQLMSPDIAPRKTLPNSLVYDGLGCQGKNVSPALNWVDAPKGTKSFAVTMYDPDAPTGGWWHWIMIDIPANVTSLERDAGSVAAGVAPAGSQQLRNDFHEVGYGGACPPAGSAAHRYQFKVYALDVEHLDVTPEGPPERVRQMLNRHALATAEIVATYGR